MTTGAEPRYSVTQWATPHNGTLEDIEQITRTGGHGIGLWTGKFGDTPDDAVLEALEEHRLTATFCLPEVWTILPVPFGKPGIEQDPEARTDMICEEIPRLARFDPVAVMVGPGVSGDPENPAGPLDAVEAGLARIADVAAKHDLQVAFELLAERRGSPLPTLPGIVEFIDGVGRDNVGVFFDFFHSWSEPNLHERLRKYADRINGVHVCDIRWEERSAFDRELPGEGRGVAPEIMATLIESGYEGWWELEVFSDDGTFGNEFPDSLWAIPHEEFLRMGKEAFDMCYRKAIELVEERPRR